MRVDMNCDVAARVAEFGRPSFESVGIPAPATVVMIPLAASARQTRCQHSCRKLSPEQTRHSPTWRKPAVNTIALRITWRCSRCSTLCATPRLPVAPGPCELPVYATGDYGPNYGPKLAKTTPRFNKLATGKLLILQASPLLSVGQKLRAGLFKSLASADSATRA